MDIDELKKTAAKKAVEYVKDGMVVGLGTGSTTRHAIIALGQMVKNGLDIVGVATSIESEKLAREVGIRVDDINEHPVIDLTIDGADEFDPYLNLIKGLGGALLREKIVASITREEIIIVDHRKKVSFLGEKSLLPVEVVRFGHKRTADALRELGCEPVLRQRNGEIFITDNGNYIYDCHFKEGIRNPWQMQQQINSIPGVVENGLFINIARRVIMASPDGIEVFER